MDSDISTLTDEICERGRKRGPLIETVAQARAALAGSKEITPEMLDRLEVAMMELDAQPEVNVTHTFTKNTYIREGYMPPNAVFLGHNHKEPHFCVILTGRMTLMNADKTTTEIVAPCCFHAQPGRKLVYVSEGVLMQNIHMTTTWPEHLFNDVDAMEDFLYARTEAWKEHRAAKQLKA